MACLATPAVFSGTAAAAPTAALEQRLAADAPDARIAVIATLRDQVDGRRYEGRPGALLRALRTTAAGDGAAIAEGVDGPVRAFWLINAVTFTGTPDEIRAVAGDPDVAAVDLDLPVVIADAAMAGTAVTPFPDAGPGDWGLNAIHVPGAWSAFGVRGEGITIGTIDTGVDASHPDLAGKVAAWRDFAPTQSRTPIDDNGHGTHTAGTMVGGTAGGGAIGVAPGARLVVARAMGANGSGSGSALLAAAQWLTDPDGDPATADQPSVINNSWSAATANDTWFRPMLRRWLELGIVPVFAAGNTGPAAGTVGSPAGYPEAIAVGAMDADSSVPGFSGRGPVIWQNSDGMGPAAGTVLAKPDLVAPGVGITSTYPRGYTSFSGTSMASPHVAGIAALVRQVNPALSPAGVADVLRSSAADVGTPGIDGVSGAGRVDALRALEIANGPGPDTTFARTPATLTRARTLDYVIASLDPRLAVRTRVDGAAWSAPTADLAFSLALAEGRHVIEAQAIDLVGGAVDATPARHVVTIDRTGPAIVVSVFPMGTATNFRARVSDAVPGSIRWSFGDGETARGARVRRSFAESRARRVTVSARDLAGNVSYRIRTIRPRAASAVRGLLVPSVVSRRSREMRVAGQLVRPATLRAALRPIRASVAGHPGPEAAFETERLGPRVSRTAVATSGAVGFRLRVSLRGLAPGAYRLELTAGEAGTRMGRLPLIRRIVVR